MDYKTAMKHKSVVVGVACGSASKDRSTMIGVLFDEASRSVS